MGQSSDTMNNQIPFTQEILALATNIGLVKRSTYQNYLDRKFFIKPVRVPQGYGLAVIDPTGNERVRGFGKSFRSALKDLLENMI